MVLVDYMPISMCSIAYSEERRVSYSMEEVGCVLMSDRREVWVFAFYNSFAPMECGRMWGAVILHHGMQTIVSTYDLTQRPGRHVVHNLILSDQITIDMAPSNYRSSPDLSTSLREPPAGRHNVVGA